MIKCIYEEAPGGNSIRVRNTGNEPRDVSLTYGNQQIFLEKIDPGKEVKVEVGNAPIYKGPK